MVRLKPHQEEAIKKLKRGSILCADVGTGKSLTAIGYYYYVVCKGVRWERGGVKRMIGPMLEPRPLYIITTAKKRDGYDWEHEIEKFGAADEIEVTVDSWNNIAKYINVIGAFFIFDEQRVTGKGKWVKSFYKIAKKNNWILLSATPGDTYLDYIPVFVANGYYANRTDFLRRHAIYHPFITKFPKIIDFRDKGKLEKIRRSITVLMKYEKSTNRKWKDVIVSYDKDLYKKIVKDRWDPWKNEPIKDISGCCYLMRKVANTGEERAKKMFWIAMAGWPRRAIVFYNFDYELNEIKETLESIGEEMGVAGGDFVGDFKVAEWNGHQHEPVPETESWLYLVQYAAGCEGWNCTSTNKVIFYSQTYSYKQFEQAAGRIDRLDTKYEDLYYYVIRTKAPIDDAIAHALKNKKDFNERLFWREKV